MLKSIRAIPVAFDFSPASIAACFLQGMVFVGAFLLFNMEPLVGRLLAPHFGGAVHVWLTSMMFFQAMLLAGYLYAYLFARRLGRWHLLILFLPLINLPLKIASGYASEMPILTLLSLLVTHIALPFAVLATTAIVGQLWLAHSDLAQAANPYPLYAASNAGSLLALIGYPFLVEPFLGLRAQTLLWTGGYVVYIALVLATWNSIRPDFSHNSGRLTPNVRPAGLAAPGLSEYSWWLWLSFLTSGFLLAATSHIALEIGSFPLIWIAPLALYLGSFIITFRSEGGVPKILVLLLPVILPLSLIFYLVPSQTYFQFALNLLVFFLMCLYAHGNLYDRRPSVAYLTNYYLTIAVGGWLGGIFVSLIAPKLFSGLFEYPLLCLCLSVTIAWTQGRRFLSYYRQLSYLVRLPLVFSTVFLLISLAWVGIKNIMIQEQCLHSQRSFYGIYRVVDLPPDSDAPKGFRILIHGETRHGGEYLDGGLQSEPTTYYCSRGAIGDVLRVISSPRHLAVVGLGVGTIAAYTERTDTITFFEIDPGNEAVARSFFSFLRNSRGPVDIVPGDGRLSLIQAAKSPLKYHLILIDAFSGDGIPTHLLTREAIQSYLNCLTEDGLLLFHISNRYFNLSPVLKATANELNLSGCLNDKFPKIKLRKYDINPTCVLLAKNNKTLQPVLNLGWIPFGAGDGLPTVAPWSDDYINLIDPLLAQITAPNCPKTKQILSSTTIDQNTPTTGLR